MAGEPRKTVLYMLRHGEPAEDHQHKYYGQMDVPLSERGIRQSLATAQRLASIPFDAVYASDLQRAGHLADAIADPLDLPVRRLEIFRERKFGTLQGLSEDEMREKHPEEHAAWLNDKIFYSSGEGENFEVLQQRIVPAVQMLVEAFEGGRVALATHGGPIRVTLAHVLGMPLANVFHFTLDYGGVNVIEFMRDAHPRVKLVNG